MSIRCICIACDVKSSRSLKKDFVSILMECAERVNQQYKDELYIPFGVRNGDELIGVAKDFAKGYKLMQNLIDALEIHQIYMYIGIGLGQLDSSNSSIHTMNGSAVLNAITARDRFLKENHLDARNWIIEDKGSSIYFYSDEYPYQALNALNYAIQEKIHNRSEKQKEVIRMVKENPTLTYEQIGEQMGYKSPKSTVSYLLSRAQLSIVKTMEDSLVNLLEELQSGYRKKGD